MSGDCQIRILFLTPSLNTPSTRYRILHSIPMLEKLRFHVTVKPIPKSTISRWRLFQTLPHFDIVFLQKKLFQYLPLRYLRRQSKILVYDFDDAVLYRDPNAAVFKSAARLRQFKSTVRLADMVIAGNDYLQGLALPYNPNVIVIPTGINTDIHTPRTTSRKHPPVTIGWVGSKPNLIYLKQLVGPINRLYAINQQFRFKMVCDAFIEGFDCPVEKKIWSAEDAVRDFHSIDIGVMPLTDDPWTRGKCAFKLLQYMSCGIASVASLTEVTSGIIDNGENGILAADESGWIEALLMLITDAGRRRSMGQKARQSLKGRFDMKTIASAYGDALKKIFFEKNQRS